MKKPDIDLSKLSGTTMHLRLPDGRVIVWLTPTGEIYDYANPQHRNFYPRKHYFVVCDKDGCSDLATRTITLDSLDYESVESWGYSERRGYVDPHCSKADE
jgi:hypothetical protein